MVYVSLVILSSCLLQDFSAPSALIANIVVARAVPGETAPIALRAFNDSTTSPPQTSEDRSPYAAVTINAARSVVASPRKPPPNPLKCVHYSPMIARCARLVYLATIASRAVSLSSSPADFAAYCEHANSLAIASS